MGENRPGRTAADGKRRKLARYPPLTRTAMRSLILIVSLLFSHGALAVCQQPILDQTEQRLMGGEENLCESYGGKVLLIVNTASKCGFTPQYEGLETLYKTNKDAGLVVLGFPSDQFLGQEFSDEKEIEKFCRVNYGVSFPMFKKTEVKGKNASPLYKALKAATGEQPSWNFNKYLIGRDGKVIAHYGSKVKPEAPELAAAIKAALSQPAP
jgi:glutathione peroxidase